MCSLPIRRMFRPDHSLGTRRTRQHRRRRVNATRRSRARRYAFSRNATPSSGEVDRAAAARRRADTPRGPAVPGPAPIEAKRRRYRRGAWAIPIPASGRPTLPFVIRQCLTAAGSMVPACPDRRPAGLRAPGTGRCATGAASRCPGSTRPPADGPGCPPRSGRRAPWRRRRRARARGRLPRPNPPCTVALMASDLAADIRLDLILVGGRRLAAAATEQHLAHMHGHDPAVVARELGGIRNRPQRIG